MVKKIALKAIKTKRLCLRPVRLSDASMMHQAMKDSFKMLKAWMPWAQQLASLKDTEYYLQYGEKLWDNVPQDGLELPLQIVSLDGETFLGASGLKPANVQIPSFEVGYWVNQSFGDQGYITEAMCALVHYLLTVVKARRVEINCERDNIKSKQIPVRLGFDFEGQLKNQRMTADGKTPTDSLIFSCTDVKQLPPIEYDWE